MDTVITLEDFIKRFKAIKAMGWVKTHRAGNTGVGKTLEDLLGISENNIQGPDFGRYELKSGRMNSNSMLTLITKSPDPKGSNKKLVEKFGYYSDDARNVGKKVLHTTLRAGVDTKISNTGNTLRPDYFESLETEHGKLEALTLISNYGIEELYWPIDTFKTLINKKLGKEFVYVRADNRGAGENEEFFYKEAYILQGVDSENIVELIKRGIMYVDIRIGQYEDGTCHDHGTGFRIKECDQHYLYAKKIRLDQ